MKVKIVDILTLILIFKCEKCDKHMWMVNVIGI